MWGKCELDSLFDEFLAIQIYDTAMIEKTAVRTH